MEKLTDQTVKLFVVDIDNTLFDWVSYYVPAVKAMLNCLEALLGVPYAQLAKESQEVFGKHHSIEYPFLIQELPAVMERYGDDVEALLQEAVTPCREAFMTVAREKLQPYPGVLATLDRIRKRTTPLSLVALTDAPRYVAMWKLNKLGLLPYFDAIYGLADPRLPTANKKIKVSPDILLKYVEQHSFDYKGKIRILPEEYEKPGVKGLKMVLLDYDLEAGPLKRNGVLWVGDNLRKDIGLGNSLGITTAWARYGAYVAPELLAELHEFSPPANREKNLNLTFDGLAATRPAMVLEEFADILKFFEE